LTSGGIDSGARPICDGRVAEAENDREETAGKAGRRNAGMETEAIALSKPLDRAVDSIVWMLVMLVDLKLKLEFLKRSTHEHVIRSSAPNETFAPKHHALNIKYRTGQLFWPVQSNKTSSILNLYDVFSRCQAHWWLWLWHIFVLTQDRQSNRLNYRHIGSSYHNRNGIITD
jgi:hypothetical protein